MREKLTARKKKDSKNRTIESYTKSMQNASSRKSKKQTRNKLLRFLGKKRKGNRN